MRLSPCQFSGPPSSGGAHTRVPSLRRRFHEHEFLTEFRQGGLEKKGDVEHDPWRRPFPPQRLKSRVKPFPHAGVHDGLEPAQIAGIVEHAPREGVAIDGARRVQDVASEDGANLRSDLRLSKNGMGLTIRVEDLRPAGAEERGNEGLSAADAAEEPEDSGSPAGRLAVRRAASRDRSHPFSRASRVLPRHRAPDHSGGKAGGIGPRPCSLAPDEAIRWSSGVGWNLRNAPANWLLDGSEGRSSVPGRNQRCRVG